MNRPCAAPRKRPWAAGTSKCRAAPGVVLTGNPIGVNAAPVRRRPGGPTLFVGEAGHRPHQVDYSAAEFRVLDADERLVELDAFAGRKEIDDVVGRRSLGEA